MKNKNIFRFLSIIVLTLSLIFFIGVGCSNPEITNPADESHKLSDNAFIKSISFFDGVKLTPSFDKSKTEYDIDVTNDVKNIYVVIKSEDLGATILANSLTIGNGVKTNLSIDKKAFILIEVTAEDGVSTMEYSIRIKKKSVTTTTIVTDTSDDATTTTLTNGGDTGVTTTIAGGTTTVSSNNSTTTNGTSVTTTSVSGGTSTTNGGSTTTNNATSTTSIVSTTSIIATTSTSTSTSTTSTTTTTTTIPYDGVKIYYKSASAPQIWGWEDGGKASFQLMGYNWDTNHPTMVASEYSGWFKFEIPRVKDGTDILSTPVKNLKFKFNQGGEINRGSGKSGFYDPSTSSWTDTFPGGPTTTTTTYVGPPTTTIQSTSVFKLGAIYSPTQTIFRIWSPDYSNVKVYLDGQEHTCNKISNFDGYTDIYEATVSGNHKLKEYQFRINGKGVRDPYGVMVKAGTNNNIVMDMSSITPTGGWASKPTLTNREDSIVYEVHVRDFTIDSSSGVSSNKKGKFTGMTETGTTHSGVKTGIDHLKELGVTHVQILPFYDFATTMYNWGYDPVNYNIPEDQYSETPNDYENRVREVKNMINEYHKNGIRVIMDVVYNHTFGDEMFKDITRAC